MIETKCVQLQGKTELISIFCCSSSCTRPAQLFNLCAEPWVCCWLQQWCLLFSRPVTKGRKRFLPLLEKCVGHCSKYLGPSQKTLRTSWCPKLVTSLLLS